MQVLFKDKAYEVQLDERHLIRPLVDIVYERQTTQLLSPLDALRFGVHNGGYFNSTQSLAVHGGIDASRLYFNDFELTLLPSWYKNGAQTELGYANRNYFGVSASKPLDYWQDRGWIQPGAPEGWFEAYTNVAQHGSLSSSSGIQYSNYAIPGLPPVHWTPELKRMLSFVSRHSAQVAKACPADLTKRRRQRQALLNWASPLAFI
jgi:hypothetical protein